jgi:hypothetical protein
MPWEGLTNGRVDRAVLFDHNGQEITPSHESEDRSDGLDLPHVITFAALYRGASYTYNHLFSEALKHSRTNAMAMRRDAWLMCLLRERCDETLSKPWRLEVDNPRDKWQKTVCAGMTKIVQSIFRHKRMQRYLLQGALWYGRYGANVRWQWKEMYLPLMQTSGAGTGQVTSAPSYAKGKVLTITKHKPVNGDKLGHHQDDTPYVLVNSSWTDHVRGERQIIYPNSAMGPALLLRGSWREQIIIHSSDPDDMDYFDAEQAEAVHGKGMRDVIYWLDFLRRDYFGAVTEMLNRIGLGLVVIYYDASNSQAKLEAEKTAKHFSRRSVIVMPRTNDGVSQAGGVEVVETPMAGASIMLELQKHVEEQIERYMIGQLISGGGGTSNPLEGTGRSEFAADTKSKTCMADARDLDETWTGSEEEPGPVSIIKKWTYSYADFPVRYVTVHEHKDPDKAMTIVDMAVNMGVEFPIEPIRELTGIRAPEEGETTVGGKEQMMAEKELEAKAKGFPPGASGKPGEGDGDQQEPEKGADYAANYGHDVSGEPRLPPGSPKGGEWTDDGEPTTKSALEEMAITVKFYMGKDDPDLAQSWINLGFSEPQCADWGDVGVHDPVEAARYRDAGISPEKASRLKSPDDYGISPARAKALWLKHGFTVEEMAKWTFAASEPNAFAATEPIVEYSSTLTVSELLEIIRRQGPAVGQSYVNGLLDMLKKQPYLRRDLSLRDLAFVQSLSLHGPRNAQIYAADRDIPADYGW